MKTPEHPEATLCSQRLLASARVALPSTAARFPISIPLRGLVLARWPSPDLCGPEDTHLSLLLDAVRTELEDDSIEVEDVLLAPSDFGALAAATERLLRARNPDLGDAEVAASMAWWKAGTVMEPLDGEHFEPGHVYVRAAEFRGEKGRDAAARAVQAALAQRLAREDRVLRARRAALAGPDDAEMTTQNGRALATTKLVYLASSGCYYARSRNGRSVELHAPKDEQAARKYLVGVLGFAPAQARKVLDEMLLPCADTVGCEPGQGPVYEDEEGRVCLNTYVPSDIVPEPGDFPVLDAVLSYVTGHDPEAKAWLINWFAFAVQNPTTTMRTAPVLCGAQRTGKSLMANMIRAIIGNENCAAVRNKDVTSGYTGHFVSKLFVVMTEAEAADVRHARANAKYFTGEPKVYSEAKYGNPVEVKNRMKWMATSNETLPVSVEKDDTRWAIFRNDSPPPPEYVGRMNSLFGRANEWSPAGLAELRAFAYFLLTYPVDDALAGNVLKNAAREEAIELAAGSVQAFAGALDEGVQAVVARLADNAYQRDQLLGKARVIGRPDAAATDGLYALYKLFCSVEGHKPVAQRRFTVELQRARPGWTRHANDHRNDTRLRLAGGAKVSAFSSLPLGEEGQP